MLVMQAENNGTYMRAPPSRFPDSILNEVYFIFTLVSPSFTNPTSLKHLWQKLLLDRDFVREKKYIGLHVNSLWPVYCACYDDKPKYHFFQCIFWEDAKISIPQRQYRFVVLVLIIPLALHMSHWWFIMPTPFSFLYSGTSLPHYLLFSLPPSFVKSQRISTFVAWRFR